MTFVAAQNAHEPSFHISLPAFNLFSNFCCSYGKIIPVSNWGVQFIGEYTSKFSYTEFLREVEVLNTYRSLREVC
jgi:hypothetical protein